MTGWAEHSPGDPWGDRVAGMQREAGSIHRVTSDEWVNRIERREGLDALTAEVQADGDLSAEERTSLLGRISVYQSDMQRAAVGDATEEAVRSLRG